MRIKIPETWHEEADVVVVGYGGAGAAAAITAHDAGAEVLVLEKASSREAGGNTRISGNVWLNPEPQDKAVTYFKAMCGDYAVPEEMIRVCVEELGENNEWVKSLGGQPMKGRPRPSEFADLPGAECVHVYVNGPEVRESALWLLLQGCVESRGIRVLYETPGKRLIRNHETNEIIGIIAQRGGKDISVKARKAVVLTCGGFQNNPDMIRNYLTNLPNCYPLGTPYNTGDGIRMALDVGADLWHMNNISGPQYSFKLPGRDVAIFPRKLPGDSYIFVAGTGERFIFEQFSVLVTTEGQPRPLRHGKVWKYGQWIPSPTPPSMYCVFDEKLRRKGPIYPGATQDGSFSGYKRGWVEHFNLYSWSKDNSEEIRKGWIKRADTIGELASRLDISPEKLENTISTYNRYCEQRRDPDFNRDPNSLEPIDEPPYYGIPLVPCFVNTQGGPRRNDRAQIVDPYGSPIPRLYSAGELGSIFSFLYQGAGNVGECLAFGRVAGRNAVAEKPWC